MGTQTFWPSCAASRIIGCCWLFGKLKNKRSTWFHLLFYFTSYVLNMFRTLIYPSSEACDYSVEFHSTPTQPHRNSNTHRTKYNTTNVVIQQHSRKLLMMDILTSETCWAHKKWNKIASDIKLVFLFSTITMMHGPINISKICKFIQFFFSIKFFSPSFVKQTCRVTVCILIYSQAKIFTLPGLCAA